ncbi:MAG: hypothetical protein HOP24_03925 [Sideroxydans sp.]|nr:hypothetical protein [Sideroxydans sp.]
MSIKLLVFLSTCLAIFWFIGEPPLPKELAEIKCVSEEAQSHSRVTYAKAKVFFLCLSGKYLDKPTEETCHIYDGNTICEKEGGRISLTRTIDNVVYAAMYEQLTHEKILTKEPTSTPDSLYESEFFTYFIDQPTKPGSHGDFEETETDYKFLMRDAGNYLPLGFTLLKGAICDRRASVSDSGYCTLDAKTNSLYWRIIIKIHKKAGTEITESQYRNELTFWRPYFNKLVDDPRL